MGLLDRLFTHRRAAATQGRLTGVSPWWAEPADPAHPDGARNGQVVMMGADHHPRCLHYEWGPCTCVALATADETKGLPRTDADLIRVAFVLRGACRSEASARYVVALGRALAHWPGQDGRLITVAVAAAAKGHAVADEAESEQITPQDPAFDEVHQALYQVNNSLVYVLEDLDRRWEMTAAVEALISRETAPQPR